MTSIVEPMPQDTPEAVVPDFTVLHLLQAMRRDGVAEVDLSTIDNTTKETLLGLAERQCVVDEVHQKVRSHKRNTSGRRAAAAKENAAGKALNGAIVSALHVPDTKEARQDNMVEIISTRSLLRALGGKALVGVLRTEDDPFKKPWDSLDVGERAAGEYHQN